MGGGCDLNILNTYMNTYILYSLELFFKNEVEDRLESPGCRESRLSWALGPSLYLGPQSTQGLEDAVTLWGLNSAPPCHAGGAAPILKEHSFHDHLTYALPKFPVLAGTPSGCNSGELFSNSVGNQIPTWVSFFSALSPPLLISRRPPIPLGGSSELGQHLRLLLQHLRSCWICSSKPRLLSVSFPSFTQLRRGPVIVRTSTFLLTVTNWVNLGPHLVHPGSPKQLEKCTSSRGRWQKRCSSPASCLPQGSVQA